MEPRPLAFPPRSAFVPDITHRRGWPPAAARSNVRGVSSTLDERDANDLDFTVCAPTGRAPRVDRARGGRRPGPRRRPDALPRAGPARAQHGRFGLPRRRLLQVRLRPLAQGEPDPRLRAPP